MRVDRKNYMKVPINEAAFAASAAEFIDKPFSVKEFSARFHKMVLNHRILIQTKGRQREIEWISKPDERRQGPEGPDVDLLKVLQKRLGAVQKNRQVGLEKEERHG